MKLFRNSIILVMALMVGFSAPSAIAQKIQVSNRTDQNISIEDTFRLGKNQFIHGQYDEAIASMNSLIYPLILDSEDDVIEARRVLAIAYYLTGRRQEATSEFTKLLYLRPTYTLDPFLVAPPIIEFFEQIRKKLKPQLAPIIAEKEKAEQEQIKNSCNPDLLAKQTLRLNYHYNNRALAFFPFGIGQLQNGHKGFGYTSMTLQIAALTVNITSAAIAYRSNATYANLLRNSANGQIPYDTAQLDTLSKRGRTMMITNLISLGVFAAVWFTSMIHANYYYEPYSIEYSNEPVDPALLKRELSK